MRIQAYLCVAGEEAAIKAIQEHTRVPNATIQEYAQQKHGSSGNGRLWRWKTRRVPIDINETDRDLRALLLAHESIFPVIKKHRGAKTTVTMQVVTQYDENEGAQGLHLSAETISLLNALGAELDNDVVSLMPD